jgi:hypothetical protein
MNTIPRPLKPLADALAKSGILLESGIRSPGGHYRLHLRKGPLTYLYYTGYSPSDHRALRNATKDIERAFRQMEQNQFAAATYVAAHKPAAWRKKGDTTWDF